MYFDIISSLLCSELMSSIIIITYNFKIHVTYCTFPSILHKHVYITVQSKGSLPSTFEVRK